MQSRKRLGIPFIAQEVQGHPLFRLDNVAESQNPNQVIDAVSKFYQHTNSNIHRVAHEFGGEAKICMWMDVSKFKNLLSCTP